MVRFRTELVTVALFSLALLAGCSYQKPPDVAGATRKALDQAGLKDVSVTQDRDEGVVTLGGKVRDDAGKAQAESIAKSLAGNQVVSDEIAVVPSNAAADTRDLYADLDNGIQSNLDAALIQNRIPGAIHHSTKNGVVTLSGTVNSDQARAEAQQVASQVPNVQQVVNELQVKDQKATSTK